MENSKGKLVVIYVAMYIQLHWRHSSSIISFRRWKWNQILLAFGGVLLKTASRTYWSACVDFLNPERLSFSYDFFLNQSKVQLTYQFQTWFPEKVSCLEAKKITKTWTFFWPLGLKLHFTLVTFLTKIQNQVSTVKTIWMVNYTTKFRGIRNERERDNLLLLVPPP